MWRAQLNRSIREIRFQLKPAPEHHGVWYVFYYFVFHCNINSFFMLKGDLLQKK
jgi:hypothetical protein